MAPVRIRWFGHSGFSITDPSIDLIFFEFPKTADFVGGHASFTYPFIDCISFDSEVFPNFVHG